MFSTSKYFRNFLLLNISIDKSSLVKSLNVGVYSISLENCSFSILSFKAVFFACLLYNASCLGNPVMRILSILKRHVAAKIIACKLDVERM